MPFIRIQTAISGVDSAKTLARFDLDLFKALSPVFPKLHIARFDGSKPGDLVDIRLNFYLFKLRWLSKISAEHLSSEEAWFIDEGIKLPFFLSTWHHKHVVKKENNYLIISDEINFTSPFKLLAWIVYPLLYGQFAARKKVYQTYFGSPSAGTKV